jgi:hypothetical protein
MSRKYKVGRFLRSKHARALGMHGGDHKSEGFQGSRDYLEKDGRGSGYRISRLKRD